MVLPLQLSTKAQIDQHKLDSLRRSIDSSARAHTMWQDSFTKAQDSIYQSAVNNTRLSKQNHLEREVQRRRNLQGIFIALLLVVVAVLLLLRRRKNNT